MSFLAPVLRWFKLGDDVTPAGRALLIEQFQMLTKQIPVLYLALIVNTISIAYAIPATVHWFPRSAVPSAFIVVSAMRLIYWLNVKASTPTVEGVIRQLVRTRALAVVLNVVFAVWSIALFHNLDVDSRVTVSLLAFVGTVGSAYCLGSFPSAARLTLLLSALPISLQLLASGNSILICVGVNLLLLLVLLVRMLNIYHRSFENIVVSRAETVAAEERARGLQVAAVEIAARFDVALNNMSQGLCFFDRDARLIVCNSRYVDMYGLGRSRVRLGTTLREIVDLRFEAGSFPDMTKEEYLAWRKSIAVSDDPSDTVVKLRNGRVFGIRHRTTPDGGWVATHEDITEREDAANAMAEQNRRFDAALNNMPHGLSMFDAAQRLIVCNRRYAEMYRLPKHLTERGATLDQIMEHRIGTGQGPLDLDIFRQKQRVRTGQGDADSHRLALTDGRILQIYYEPMIGGGWVTTHQDITEATRVEAEINHLARHDALTGLSNRMVFRDDLDGALQRLPQGESVAVLCLDLDQFKAVNDTLGHPIGDELLKVVADRLRLCVREVDSIARLGGDEFAIIQPTGAQPTAATSLADRVIEVLGAPYVLASHQVVVGTSVGIAVAPQDGLTADQLLKNADLALYRAKSDGRGVYRFFEPAMDAKMQARRALELDLRKALENNEFELFYQPLIGVSAREIVAFEALARWRHPERGLVSPGEFIPLAEEIGLIVPLGAWVLREACAQAVKWPNQIKVTVNLSPIQFNTNTLVLNVMSALAASGLSPQRLELEITETVMMQDTDRTLTTLRDLKAIGVSISMDDFGTGYSSLSYLRKFPFDKIKIDQSFVRDLSNGEESLAIVRAVTGLGRSLGMATTAEGVESLQQLQALRAEGCSEMQGFYFSPPVPVDDVPRLIVDVNQSLKAA